MPAAPAVFIRNDGQVDDPSILYHARAGGVLAGFGAGFVRYVMEPAGADLTGAPPEAPTAAAPAPTAVVTVSFEGGGGRSPLPMEPSPGKRNFFLGGDDTEWFRDVPSFGALVYREAWPNIDLVYRATAGGPKYEVVARPGADLSAVTFTYRGVDRLTLTPDGALVASTAAGPLTDSAPTASSAGAPVACAFVLRAPASAGFECSGWDGGQTLTIDPLVFSTYLGGSGTDYGRGVHVATDGSIYVGGYTSSSNFPTTNGAFDTGWNGNLDFYITRFDASGTSLLWSTYIGGTSNDYAQDLFVDAAGGAYITGYVLSTNFPTTAGAHDATHNGGSYDLVVSKIDATGSTLVFSTYLGGTSNDYGRGVAVGANDTVYVTGESASSNFPITAGAFQTSKSGTYAAFVTRLNQTGAVLNSTFLGGNSNDYGAALRTDAAGLPVAVGRTTSSTFPTTANGEQRSLAGGYDVFVAQLDAELSSLTYSTYLGGSSSDYANAVAISGQVAFVTGYTLSSNYPTTGSSFSSSIGGVYDAFLSKVNLSTGDLDYSSYLGGSSYDYGWGVTVNGLGEAVLTGYTQSTNFPVTTYRDQQNLAGSYDAYIVRLNAAGNQMVYGSFLGGSSTDYGYAVATDANGTAYITGYTVSSNFPTTQGAYDTTAAGGEAFLTKIEMRKPRLTMTTEPPGLYVFNQNDNVSTPFVDECTTLRRVSVGSPQYDGEVRYVFDRWSNGGNQLQTIDCSPGDVTLTAYFRTEFRANLSTSPAGLPLTVDGIQRSTPASFWWENGTQHRVNAMPLYTSNGVRYAFDSWSAGGTGEELTHIMTGPLQIVALYDISEYLFEAETDRPGTFITLDGNRYDGPVSTWLAAGSEHDLAAPGLVMAGTETRHTFTNWSDGGPMSRSFNATAPMDLVAHYQTEYWTTLATDPPEIALELDGVETPTPYSAWWPEGESHRIQGPWYEVEVLDTRYVLTGWVDSYSTERIVYADGPVTYTALFSPSSFRASVDTVPAGLQVVLDREAYTAPVELWWEVGTDHVVQALSPQAGVAARYVFASWSDHLQVTHVVTATGPLGLTARFTTEFQVIVDTEPTGLGLTVDGVAATAPHTVWWREGGSHDIGVSPTQSVGANQRWDFDSWSDGGERIHAVAATGPSTFVATFAPTFRLTIQSAHAPPPCDVTDCWYRGGATATFQVDSPQYASNGVRFAFARWTGDYSSPEEDASVVMDAPKTVTAIWTLQYELTVVSARGNATGAGWYDEGAMATVSVDAMEVAEGGVTYRFVGWTGGAASPSAQATVSVDGPKTVTATWEEVKPEEPVPPAGGGGSGAAGGSVDAAVVGGVGVAAALAAVIGLLVMRRRGARDNGEEGLLAPAAAPQAVQVSVPARGVPPGVAVAAPAPRPAAKPLLVSVPAAPAAAARPGATVPSAAAPAARVRPVRRLGTPAPAPAAATGRAAEGRPSNPAEPIALRCPTCAEPIEAAWAVCPFCDALLLK
ncbi:MAG TPA: SBBP repeat-containing protein [Candidatus Thermoplasmatota archaeon]